jgi:hypothetical protein
MGVAGTTGLPLKPVPGVRKSQKRTEDVVCKGLQSNNQVVRNNIRVVLDPVPNKYTSYTIIRSSHVQKAREVSVEVLLLYISRAKGYKNRRYARREKAGLGLQVVALISPKWTSPI